MATNVYITVSWKVELIKAKIMAKRFVIILMMIAIGLGLAIIAGCENDAQTGALIGAGVGAVAGQAIGGDTQSTLIGAGAGAAGGYIIGNESDKKK